MDISLFTTSELVEELARRSPCGLLCMDTAASRDDVDELDGKDVTGRTITRRRWWGDDHTCLGMAYNLLSVINRDVMELPSISGDDE